MASLIVANYALSLVTIGTVFNSLTLIILCRLTSIHSITRSTFPYMRAIAIFDILMLYGWNLDHYLGTVHGFTIQRLSIPLCRIFSFLNYFAAQSSAWLRVLICFDRYLALNYNPPRWFKHTKYGLHIILGIIVFFTLVNIHFLLFGCSYKANGTISVSSTKFSVYPLWEYINLGVYNCIPFIFMTVFNTHIIYHLVHCPLTPAVQNGHIPHLSISITLVITTFLFLFMTVPSIVAFGFFFTANSTLLNLFDGLLYSYHILSFPLYFLTYNKFRRQCFRICRCYKKHQIIRPLQPIISPNNKA